MIKSPEEFINLRNSENSEDQFRASNDFAEIQVWLNVIHDYPEYKVWVIKNKNIQIEILEYLSKDIEENVRSAVARKRKINENIFLRLSTDTNEDVRYALMCNTKLPIVKKIKIYVDDSNWLKTQLSKFIDNASR